MTQRTDAVLDFPAGLSMLVTDLDGTLLPAGGEFSPRDIQLLERMGSAGMQRVIATGRNLFSLKKVIPRDFPVDHVIFSSGAGILDWNSQQLIHRAGMAPGRAIEITKVLDQQRINYMVHRQVPHNHWFWFSKLASEQSDFALRLRRYRGFAHIRPQKKANWMADSVSQVLAITPPTLERLSRLHAVLGTRCHLIRTTSPLDGNSMWIELMPIGVSKAAGIVELCRRIGISRRATAGVGNDYNDLDMLRATGRAAVTETAPLALKREFPVVAKGSRGVLTSFLIRLKGLESASIH